MSVSPKYFELLLVELQEELCKNWVGLFDKYPEFSIHHGDFSGNQGL